MAHVRVAGVTTRRSPGDPAAYGDVFAPVYDDWYADVSDVEATVTAVQQWAGDGLVLELGVGTGRLALPLAGRGCRVVGVDASLAMLTRCAAKQADEPLILVCADMAAPPLVARFDVVFVAFNTFLNLDTASAQRRCLLAVAELLGRGGSFFVETFIPTVDPPEREHREESRSDGSGGRILTTAVRDPGQQTVVGVHIHSPAQGPVVRLPWSIRYLHLDQLDAMASDAGLVLADRWEAWTGAPFSEESPHHVSRYTVA